MTDCKCRIGNKCAEHQSCGPDRWDHEWARQEPFVQSTPTGYVCKVTVYSCEVCDWHDSDVYYLTQADIDGLVSA
jgi:hypothetical protein